LLFDADGNRMTPTHAVKKGTRYRYYVSHPLITQARAGSPGGLRLPAPEIEQFVAKRLCQFLSEPDSILEATEQLGFDPASQQRLIDRAAQIAGSWFHAAVDADASPRWSRTRRGAEFTVWSLCT
jgi:site-specific DNA recombinase